MEEREAFASQLNDLNKKIACFEEEFMKQQEQIQHLEKERDRLVQLNEQLRLDEEMQKKDAERIQMKHLLAIDKQQLQHELEMAKLQRQLISERRRQIQYAVPFLIIVVTNEMF
jgi:flagellar hook-associated protein FlgK